jgi:hypothetical protein
MINVKDIVTKQKSKWNDYTSCRRCDVIYTGLRRCNYRGRPCCNGNTKLVVKKES